MPLLVVFGSKAFFRRTGCWFGAEMRHFKYDKTFCDSKESQNAGDDSRTGAWVRYVYQSPKANPHELPGRSGGEPLAR
jgi:hypothetical protein